MHKVLAISKKTNVATHARVLGLLLVLLLTLTACASNSGIFSGGSWQASGLQKQQLQVLAVDPNHLQHIYAGDAQDGVFASIDSGVTWKVSSVGLPTPLAINALAFDLDGKKLYAATSAGLFVSSDSAASWSRVTGVPATDSYSSLSFDPNTSQVVYVASAHSGVLESRDSGATWTNLGGNLPAVALTSVLYDPNQKSLWAAAANSIYRSTDNSATWQAMNTGLPANVGVNVLALGAVSSGSSSDLIFAGTDHGFFITSDAGKHWAQSQFSLANIKVKAVLLDATQPTVVYASTDIGVLRSNDSGQNWSDVASGLPGHQPFAGLAQGDVNYAQLLLASRGIYRYPGTAGALDPSRLLPILLVLLFFFLLYFFFARRRRLSRTRSAPATPVERDERRSALDKSTLNDRLNGHYPSSENMPGLSEDEKKES